MALQAVRRMGATEWLEALTRPGATIDFALFGLDSVSPAWEFTDRVLDDHLMYLLTDGSCVGEIEGLSVALEPGSLLWMQPGVRHTLTVGDRSRPLTLYFVRFRLRHCRHDLLLDRPPAWQRDGAWDLLEPMDNLLDELRCRFDFRELRVRALLAAICAGELRRRDPEPAQHSGALDRAQRKAVEAYVRRDLAEWPAPSDLAAQVGLSVDYFARLFTQTFGSSPRTWLVEERIRRATRLLTDTLLSVTDIAAELRYDSPSSFSHQFKLQTGVSPRTYRRSHP